MISARDPADRACDRCGGEFGRGASATASTSPRRGQGQPKKSRGQAAPNTVEEVQARVDKGCSCADVNCFKNVSPDTLLTARNTALAMTKEEPYYYVAGKLDVFRRRGPVTSHHGSIAQWMQRGERSGPLIAMKWMVTKCARLFSCTHIT